MRYIKNLFYIFMLNILLLLCFHDIYTQQKKKCLHFYLIMTEAHLNCCTTLLVDFNSNYFKKEATKKKCVCFMHQWTEYYTDHMVPTFNRACLKQIEMKTLRSDCCHYFVQEKTDQTCPCKYSYCLSHGIFLSPFSLHCQQISTEQSQRKASKHMVNSVFTWSAGATSSKTFYCKCCRVDS